MKLSKVYEYISYGIIFISFLSILKLGSITEDYSFKIGIIGIIVGLILILHSDIEQLKEELAQKADFKRKKKNVKEGSVKKVA